MRSDLPADAIQEFRVLVNQFRLNMVMPLQLSFSLLPGLELMISGVGLIFSGEMKLLTLRTILLPRRKTSVSIALVGFLGGPIVKDKLHFFLC